jgi:hypothetical protein
MQIEVGALSTANKIGCSERFLFICSNDFSIVVLA